jgi:predicted nucleic acid-binding protein
VLDEEFTEQAQALLADSARARRPLTGPPHLTAEVSNILYRRRLRSDPTLRISDEEAEGALTRFLRIPVVLLTATDLFHQAFTFAREHQLDSMYDSLYVVLAQQLGAELWTADERLLTALGNRAPWVRSIADYPR